MLKVNLDMDIQKLESALNDFGGTYFTQNLDSMWLEHRNEMNRILTRPEKALEWDRNKGSWKEYLAAAKACGQTSLYAEIKCFSWENDLVEALKDDEGVPDEDKLGKAQRFKPKDGCVERIILAFNRNGVWHTYEEVSEWAPEYWDLLSDEETHESDETEEKEMSAAEMEKHARALAQDPDFERMKGPEIRHKLRQRHPQIADQLLAQLPEILDIAKGIYADELRPKKERQLADKAQKLIASGSSTRKAADSLGVTQRVLAQILERYGKS